VAAETGRGGSASGRAFVVGTDGTPQEVRLRLGLTDGNATEVTGGELKEGAEVIVGNVERPAASPRPSGSAPRLPF
jgi:HlyD family secretion protein